MNSVNIHALIIRKIDILRSILSDTSYIVRIYNTSENDVRIRIMNKIQELLISYQLDKLSISDDDYNMYIVRENIIEKTKYDFKKILGDDIINKYKEHEIKI